MKGDLVDTWLRGVKPGSERFEVWDVKVTGLCWRLMPTGAASWSVKARRPDGKQCRPKIGGWPEVGITEARRRARAAISDIEQGGDPVAERQAERIARIKRRAAPTVSARLAEWRAAKGPSWSDRYRSETKRLCDREIEPVLGERALVETHREDWMTLIATVAQRSASVGTTLYRAASSFAGHAEVAGWVDMPLLPRRGLAVIAPQVPPRQRTLTDDELRLIWLAADSLRPKARTFVHLLAMTACREMEACDIAIGEIDFDVGTWSIPGNRTKNGRPIRLPLHAMLLGDLRAVMPDHDFGPGWRLLGEVKGNGLRSCGRIKAQLDTVSGIVGWRFHDLRRTVRTGLARMGVGSDVAERCLNHVSHESVLVRTYNTYNSEPEVLAALSHWQAHVAHLVTPKTPTAEALSLQRSVASDHDS